MAYIPRDRIVEVADAVGSVVSLDDLKMIRRIDAPDEDVLLQDMGNAATAAVERATQRLLTQREVTMRLTCLPPRRTPLGLYGGKVQSLTSVLADGVEVTNSEVYGDSPAVLVPAEDWPVITGEGYPVTIRYTAGMTVVPPDLVHAIKTLVGAMDCQREAIALNTSVTEVPMAYDYLVAPHRIRPI